VGYISYQLLGSADGVSAMENKTDTIKRSTATLLDRNKEVDLEGNTEKTKCMLMPRHQNAGQNHNIKTANRFSEHVAELKYLRMTVTNEEIKCRLNFRNACFNSVQIFSLLSCCLKA
jgi:hypothetical protein